MTRSCRPAANHTATSYAAASAFCPGRVFLRGIRDKVCQLLLLNLRYLEVVHLNISYFLLALPLILIRPGSAEAHWLVPVAPFPYFLVTPFSLPPYPLGL